MGTFRTMLRDIFSSSATPEHDKFQENARVCLSYSRAALGQTGSGHYSPIAAFNEDEDKVLIFDVARFKYPSYWVDVGEIWKSMCDPDPDAGNRPRGFVLFTRESAMREWCNHVNNSSSRSHIYVACHRYGHGLRKRLLQNPAKIHAFMEELGELVEGRDDSNSSRPDCWQQGRQLWRSHAQWTRELNHLLVLAAEDTGAVDTAAVSSVSADLAAEVRRLSGLLKLAKETENNL